MSDFNEIRAGLEKIKGHIDGHSRSVDEANEQAEKGYEKLRTIRNHLLQAWKIAKELGDFDEAANTIKAGADEHLEEIRKTAGYIGLESMNQEAASALVAAIGNLTLQSDGAMGGFRRTHGKLTMDVEGDVAYPTAILQAYSLGEKVEGEYTEGAWAVGEFHDHAELARAAIERFTL